MLNGGITKRSDYKRIFIAHCIDHKIDTVKKIQDKTGISQRNIYSILSTLSDIGVTCSSVRKQGATHYQIDHWGYLKKDWVKDNLHFIQQKIGVDATL